MSARDSAVSWLAESAGEWAGSDVCSAVRTRSTLSPSPSVVTRSALSGREASPAAGSWLAAHDVRAWSSPLSRVSAGTVTTVCADVATLPCAGP